VADLWIAALCALFLWWFGTGAILFVDRLPRATRSRGMIVATVLLAAALAAIWATAGDRSLSGALVAFTSAIVIWGWHELSFLTGFITGPRTTPCPPGARGWRRFVYATETLIHHEIAIAATGLGLGLWLWDAGNAVALWTFLVLWGMRLSAKFNIFLGAPNVAEEFLPDHLAYLKTYFARRPGNALFPASIVAGSCLTVWLAAAALAAGPGAFEAPAFALVAMIAALGTLEHWFLLLPVKEAALWRWYMESRDRRREHRAGQAPGRSPLDAPTMLGR